jgi:hypothetical protein
MSAFDVARKYLDSGVIEKTPDISEGRIIAVEICSNVLGAHIWLAFDDDFKPGDGQAVYYADELPFLATKDAEQLKGIHKAKLAFPGCRVIQEGAEAKRP